MEKDYVWWEKTVEYKFILDASREKDLQFAAPLSGTSERAAGDGVFASNAKIVLIEFKRSFNELDTEHDKFTNYDDAKEQLGEQDAHHFLIFGSCDGEGMNRDLTLHACTYFSRNDVASALNVFDYGLEPSAFNTYLTELVGLKKGDERSSGTVSPESVACAIGVSPQGVSAISLSEYYRIAMPNLYKELTPTQRHSPPRKMS